MTSFQSLGTDDASATQYGETVTAGINAYGTGAGTGIVSLGSLSGFAAKAAYLFTQIDVSSDLLMRIGTGTTSSPTWRINDIPSRSYPGAIAGCVFIPVLDPAIFADGTEIVVSGAKSGGAGSEDFLCSMLLMSERLPDIDSSISYSSLGLDETAGEQRSEMNPGTTANTKSSWVSLGDGASNLQILELSFFSQVTAQTTQNQLIDVAVGNPEVEKVAQIPLYISGGKDIPVPQRILLPASDWQSERVSVRNQSDLGGNADDVKIEVGGIGYNGTLASGGGGGGASRLINGGLIG